MESNFLPMDLRSYDYRFVLYADFPDLFQDEID